MVYGIWYTVNMVWGGLDFITLSPLCFMWLDSGVEHWLGCIRETTCNVLVQNKLNHHSVIMVHSVYSPELLGPQQASPSYLNAKRIHHQLELELRLHPASSVLPYSSKFPSLEITQLQLPQLLQLLQNLHLPQLQEQILLIRLIQIPRNTNQRRLRW